VDEEIRIAILEQVMPTSFTDGTTLATILNALKLKSVYFSMKNFIWIKFPLAHYWGQAEEEALLDSGATENFINANTVKKLRLGTQLLNFQRPVYNVDGTLNKHGTITHACNLLVKQGHKTVQQRFYVSNLGKDRFILGYPWFRAFIPDINWANATLRGPQVKMETIQYEVHQQALQMLKEKKQQGQNDDLTVSTITLADNAIIGNLTSDISWTGEHCPSQGIRPGETQESDDTSDEDNIPWVEINRMHTTVKMAYEYTEKHGEGVTLPKEFQRHATLFSDEEAKKFPPSWPYNHKIELKAEAPAKFNCKLYPMSLTDQAIEDKSLDKNLEKGYTVPLDLPYGFSTFMVPKKDSDEKRYIIDYRPLNMVTKKDITPLPNLAQCC